MKISFFTNTSPSSSPRFRDPHCRTHGATGLRKASLLTMLMIAGCATPPASRLDDMPVVLPAHWTAHSEPDETRNDPTPEDYDAGWLYDFNDPRLRELVYQAQAHNYNLRATAARLGVVEAEARIVGADLYPQVGAQFGAQRLKQNFTAQGLGPAFPSRTFNNYNLAANVSWEIDVWGRLRDRQSAALGDVQATAADLRGARLSLAANTAYRWFALIEAQLQHDLAQHTHLTYDRSTRTIQGRYERGLSPALDLRLARAQTSAALASVEARARVLDAARRDLQVLLGDYPSGDIAAADDLPQITRPVPVGLPSEMLERRPDLVAAERRLAASDTRISEARKAFLPAISLTGAYGTTSNQLENLLNNSFSVWSLAGNLVQPIFQGGRLTAALARARAQAVEALALYGQTALNAFNEVEKALAAEVFLNRGVEALRIASEESALAEANAWDNYQRGLTDIITVLESQRRAFESRSAYISARTDRLNNRVALYLALGGDFGPSDQQPLASLHTQNTSTSFDSD